MGDEWKRVCEYCGKPEKPGDQLFMNGWWRRYYHSGCLFSSTEKGMTKKESVCALVIIANMIWGPFYFTNYRLALHQNGIFLSTIEELGFLIVSLSGWGICGYLVWQWRKTRKAQQALKTHKYANLMHQK